MSSGKADIRVDAAMPDNLKVLALVAALDDGAGFCLVRLWCYASKHHPLGVMPSAESIEGAARWRGPPGEFRAALIRLGLLEADGVTLHDWPDEQPYVYGRAARVARAKRAGDASAAARKARGDDPFRKPNGMFGSTERPVRQHRTSSSASRTPSPSPPETESAAHEAPALSESKPTPPVDTAAIEAGLAASARWRAQRAAYADSRRPRRRA